MSRIKWSNKLLEAGSLIPWDRNPRRISEKQMKVLKKSLEDFGYANPIIINKDGQIIAGHHRLKAMKAAGLIEDSTFIDVRFPDRQLNEKEARDLAILDNKSGGGWDFEILLEDFQTSELLDLGFDPIELGISVDDCEEDLGGVADGDESGKDKNALNSFEIAFGSKEELAQFKTLINLLNEKYKSDENIGVRIIHHLTNTLMTKTSDASMVPSVENQKQSNAEISQRLKHRNKTNPD